MAVVVRGAALLIAWNRHFAGKASWQLSERRSVVCSLGVLEMRWENLMTSVGHDNYVSWLRESEAMNFSVNGMYRGFTISGMGDR